jgi:arylsulfatase A-like enzyme
VQSLNPRMTGRMLSRRSVFRSLGAGSLGLLAALGQLRQGAAAPARRQASEQPNILLILTDDLDTRSLEFMPNVAELLGQQGTTFANFFVTTPLCTPSRASILTGQYVHNNGVLGNAGKSGGFSTFHRLDREQSTIANWLQDAGYRTALIGKYHNGYPEPDNAGYVPPGWDEWFVGVDGTGKYFDFSVNDNGQTVAFGHGAENYSTDIFAARAVDFIRNTEPGQPFLLYLAPHAPHGPAKPAPRHAEEFSELQAPRPPSFNEPDVSDKPDWLRNAPELSAEQIDRIDEWYRQRLRSLLAIDEMVATLVAELRATGKLDNTYIFFTSDNGYQLGEHRIETAKRAPYEEAIRVPLLVRGPDVPAGRVEERMALNIDFGPTFAALAGTEAPEFVDGRSLLPLLVAETGDEWRQVILIEGFNGAQRTRPRRSDRSQDRPRAAERDDDNENALGLSSFFALRTADQLYVEHDTGERELYDLLADPYELENLITIADPTELASMSERLAELQVCAADTCRVAENRPLGG